MTITDLVELAPPLSLLPPPPPPPGPPGGSGNVLTVFTGDSGVFTYVYLATP